MDAVKNLRCICRVCTVNMKAKNPQLVSVSIFSHPGVCQRLKKYFGIEIKRDDHLPKHICVKCYKKLQDVHAFARLVVRSDLFWKKFTLSNKSNNSLNVIRDFNAEFAQFAMGLDDKSPQSMKMTTGAKIFNLLKDKQRVIAPKPQQTSTTTLVNNMSMESRRNNLEEKRQNLKAVLATSKLGSPLKAQPRIKVKSELDLKQPISSTTQQQQLLQHGMQFLTIPQPGTSPKNPFADVRLKLGQVVKDIDLLTLILKALKWPYNNDNILVQIDRLKEAPFHEVIRNPYLLQDTDLMQILNTILSPILLQRTLAPQPALPGFVSYKIPADLSVHLVTEAADDDMFGYKAPVVSQPNRNVSPKMKARKTYQRSKKPTKQNPPMRCSSPIEILSDDDSVQMFEVNVDPSLYFNADSCESLPKTRKHDIPAKKEKRSEEMLVFKLQTKHKKKGAPTKKKTDITPPVLPTPIAESSPAKSPELIIPDHTPEKFFEDKTPVQNTDKVIEAPVDNATNQSKNVNKDHVEEDSTATSNEISKDAITANDVSGEDDLWADFKVLESPDQTADISHVKSEPVSEKENSHTSVECEQSENCEKNIAEDTIAENIDVKEETPQEELKDAQESSKEEEKVVTETPVRKKRGRKPNNILVNTNSKVTPVVTEENVSSANVKKTGRKINTNVTESTPNSSKRSRKSIPAAPPVMSLRNSNTRRRICKQCGQSFTLLTDFLDHRKMHIES